MGIHLHIRIPMLCSSYLIDMTGTLIHLCKYYMVIHILYTYDW